MPPRAGLYPRLSTRRLPCPRRGSCQRGACSQDMNSTAVLRACSTDPGLSALTPEPSRPPRHRGLFPCVQGCRCRRGGPGHTTLVAKDFADVTQLRISRGGGHSGLSREDPYERGRWRKLQEQIHGSSQVEMAAKRAAMRPPDREPEMLAEAGTDPEGLQREGSTADLDFRNTGHSRCFGHPGGGRYYSSPGTQLQGPG